MVRRYHILLPVVAFLLIFCGSRSVAADISPQPTTGNIPAKQHVSWVDVETGTTLFTLEDIVRFDWDRQIFELEPACATQLLALPVVQRRDFVVKDQEGIIYRGRFYRSAGGNGDGYDGTTILLDQGPQKKLPASPFFIMTGGYPTGGGAHDRERFSERLHTALTNAGLLAAIPDADMPVRRLWSGHVWVGGDQALKASAVLFPETFRIGKDAYIHLLLYKGQHPDAQFDHLVVEAICTTSEGEFTSQQEILRITPPLLDNGIYVCKFRPWETFFTPPAGDQAYAPTVKATTLPRYPKDALNENREGNTVVAVTVDTDGKVCDVTVVTSSGRTDFDQAAVRAARRCVFTPMLVNGKSAKGVVKMLFSFAHGKSTLESLPPEPVRVTAKPGPADLSFVITAMKREGDTLVKIGTWVLPTARKIMLLPETAPVPAAVTPAP